MRLTFDAASEGVSLSEHFVFTLTSGRSGTLTLSEMLKQNTQDCLVVHEPYLKMGNPTMFGLPTYDQATGNLEALKRVVLRKSETIKAYRESIYVESSHAFLKSYWNVAPEFFPGMKVLHLIRNPLEVARSEANRDNWKLTGIGQYRGRDGRTYKRWALTGLEPIYQPFAGMDLTLFQFYFIQWIEIENRAMEFLSRFDMHERCLTLYSPRELNDPQVVPKIMDFMNFKASRKEAVLPGVMHQTPGAPTIVGDAEMREYREVIERLPAKYLEIFSRAPYSQCEWVSLLRP